MRLNRSVLLAVILAVITSSASSADQKTQDLYKSKCQGCHGADGKGSAIGKKLGAKDFQDPEVAKMSDSDLERIVTHGKNKMPAYKGKVSEQQIDALVKYIREIK